MNSFDILKKSASIFYNNNDDTKCYDFNKQSNLGDLSCWNYIASTQIIEKMSCNNECLFPPYQYDDQSFINSVKQQYNTIPRFNFFQYAFGGDNTTDYNQISNIIFSNG